MCPPSRGTGAGCRDSPTARSTKRIDEEIDRLAFELRPPALDDLGLEAALRLLVKAWLATSSIPVDVHIGRLDHRRLPATVETTVYRIVQEALTNVLKHAQTRSVSLIVERQNAEVLAIVEDDGRGFDLEAAIYAPGTGRQLGVEGMQARAALAGGDSTSRPPPVPARLQETGDKSAVSRLLSLV